MGSVISIIQLPFRLVESILSVGVAVAAGTFYPFNPDYFKGLSTILPLCEPAETEPFEDFSAALIEFRDELEDEVKPSPSKRSRHFHVRSQSEQCTTWRSRTVEAKKLYRAVAIQAQQKAIRFRRRYSLYGPPDWIDPALSILPPSGLSAPTFLPNVLPSVFPFAAPHIVLTPPPPLVMDPFIARGNRAPRQDQAFGNRLIVADAPSCSGPRPIIVNPEARRPAQTMIENADSQGENSEELSDIPSLTADECDGASSCGSSECGDLTAMRSTSDQDDSFPSVAHPDKAVVFWIEEDEDGLPDIPDSW